MLDTYRIGERLGVIRKNLLLLEKEFKGQPKEKFFQDEVFNASAERILQITIQACIDISNHIVSALGLRKPKEDNAETFRILYSEGVFPEDFSKKMTDMAGYRNVLVHGYLEVKRGQTYNNINNHLPDIVEFAKYIEKLLEANKKN